MNPTVRPGQVWGRTLDMRELTVQQIGARYAYCRDDNGRKTRILLTRMVRGKTYYLKMESPAHYVPVPSESICICGGAIEYHLRLGCLHCGQECKEFTGKTYKAWSGEIFSP